MFDLKRFRKDKKITQTLISEWFGVTQGFISRIENGKDLMPNEYYEILRNKYGDEIKLYDVDNQQLDNAVIYQQPEGIIKAPLIGQYANGGYLRGYADPEFLQEQPLFFSTRKHTGGNYVAFEVRGDSMNDGTQNAICDGDIILGRELPRQHWKNNMFLPKVFIIVHHSDGISVKEIIKIDSETGQIICHSWNNDPEYEDFELNLKDVLQLFYIKEISRNFKL